MKVIGTGIIISIGNEYSGTTKKGDPYEMGVVVIESEGKIDNYRRKVAITFWNDEWNRIKNNFSTKDKVTWTGMLDAREDKSGRYFNSVTGFSLEYADVQSMTPANKMPKDDSLPF